MKSSTVIVCLLCLESVVFLAVTVATGAPPLSVRRRGLTPPLEAFLAARRPLTILPETASANGSTKPFGELFNCCTDVVFLKIDRRRCWPRLFTLSDRLLAWVLKKCPTRDCFAFIGVQ